MELNFQTGALLLLIAAVVAMLTQEGLKMPVHDAADMVHEPIGGRFQDGELHLAGQNVAMNYFAFFLSRALPLNVVDKTGLQERYDVNLHYVPEGRVNGDGGAPPPPPADGPDLITALREQLGLHLQKGRGSVEYLVIEHVDKPSEN
jgi:uncharacterized protein (TIGR03435 family)